MNDVIENNLNCRGGSGGGGCRGVVVVGWFMMGVGEIETASFVDVCVVLTVKCTLFFREMAQQ